MQKVLCVLFLVLSLSMSAQEIDTLQSDSIIEVPPANYVGVFADIGFHYSPHLLRNNYTATPGLWIKYNRWSVGFTQTLFLGKLETFLIFPNVFELDYGHAGAHLGFEVAQSDWIRLDVTTSYRWGDMIWVEKESQTNFLRDEFKMMTFSAVVSLDRIRFFKPYCTVGYQQMRDLDLARVTNDDFSGLFFGLGIRMGYFNQ